ncbi:MAG: hypothetical protein J0G94_18555, partial [Sphingomonadales bacterium]|nr:hypothetical protein [Sphingomonadales bacterium]
TNNLSFEIAYVGSHIVHVGIPDSNLNQLTADQLAAGLTDPASLTRQVDNPFYGQIPGSSPIGGKTVAAAQLLKPYPRFQNVATYRHNSGTTNYNALEAKVEQRLSPGLRHGHYVTRCSTRSSTPWSQPRLRGQTVLATTCSLVGALLA